MASPLEAVLLLADAAQVDPGGKLHILGCGWSATSSPTSPHAVVALIKVPWDRANQPLPLSLTLLDEDGDAVRLPGSVVEQGLVLESTVEVGRPAGLAPGTPLHVPFAVNVPSLPLPPGRYEWRLRVADGTFAAPFQAVRPPSSP